LDFVHDRSLQQSFCLQQVSGEIISPGVSRGLPENCQRDGSYRDGESEQEPKPAPPAAGTFVVV